VRFKRGFCNQIAPSWLRGAILDQTVYRTLAQGREVTGFFPAYRGAPVREPSDADQR
jgi:hypothetical protein